MSVEFDGNEIMKTGRRLLGVYVPVAIHKRLPGFKTGQSITCFRNIKLVAIDQRAQVNKLIQLTGL